MRLKTVRLFIECNLLTAFFVGKGRKLPNCITLTLVIWVHFLTQLCTLFLNKIKKIICPNVMKRKEFWEKLFRKWKRKKKKKLKWVSASSKNIIFQSFTPNLSTVCPFECQWPCFFNESTFYVVHISILSFNFSQLLLHGFVLFLFFVLVSWKVRRVWIVCCFFSVCDALLFFCFSLYFLFVLLIR